MIRVRNEMPYECEGLQMWEVGEITREALEARAWAFTVLGPEHAHSVNVDAPEPASAPEVPAKRKPGRPRKPAPSEP